MTSIGKDLGTIRKHLELELEDIYQSTRIPMDILKRIEDDSLFTDLSENIIYVRSFARTYAKALKIPDHLVLKSLDQYETGNYNGLLLEAFPELREQKTSRSSTTIKPKKKDPHTTEDQDIESEKNVEPDSSPAHPRFEEKKIQPPAMSKSGRVPPPVQSVNWAKMGHKFSTRERSTPVWIIGGVVIFIIALTIFYLIYNSDWLSNNDSISQTDSVEAPPATTPGGSELSLNLADQPQDDADTTSTLNEILHLTLYAAYDRLEPVRIWSDLNPRIDPYWIEEGTAYVFEFRDSIRISGQYNNMLLFLNGRRIDNFRQLHFNEEMEAVELTRDLFTPESRWATSVSLELPENVSEPDTIQITPSF